MVVAFANSSIGAVDWPAPGTITNMSLAQFATFLLLHFTSLSIQVESHGDKAVFVHMYGPEPHPTSPDTNFDSGMLLTQYWSTYRQPLTYDERVQAAKKIRPITHPEQVRQNNSSSLTKTLLVSPSVLALR